MDKSEVGKGGVVCTEVVDTLALSDEVVQDKALEGEEKRRQRRCLWRHCGSCELGSGKGVHNYVHHSARMR